jgi:hypothetical protein
MANVEVRALSLTGRESWVGIIFYTERFIFESHCHSASLTHLRVVSRHRVLLPVGETERLGVLKKVRVKDISAA